MNNMANSQNGWEVIPTGTDPRLTAIPKVAGRVRAGAVAAIFTDLVEQFDRHVEDVDRGKDDWGYANRSIRGGTSISNHASGTAIDLNASRHPLGSRGTFTAAQRAKIQDILTRYHHNGEPTVRWGGNYTGRKDEMHFEIVGTAAKVAAVASKLKPVALPSLADWPLSRRTLSIAAVNASVKNGVATESMQTLQAILGQLETDGVWGPATKARYETVARSKALPRSRDGRPLSEAIRRLAAGKVAKVS